MMSLELPELLLQKLCEPGQAAWVGEQGVKLFGPASGTAGTLGIQGIRTAYLELTLEKKNKR